MKRWFFFLGLSVTLFLLDFALKCFAYHTLSSPILVWSSHFGIDLFLQCVTNKGGAWGILADFYKPLLAFRMLVVGLLLVYLIRVVKGFKGQLFLTLIITGAFANVFDCLYYGHVIDMIHITFWHKSYGIFNIADVLICLGCFGWITLMMKKRDEPAHS